MQWISGNGMHNLLPTTWRCSTSLMKVHEPFVAPSLLCHLLRSHSHYTSTTFLANQTSSWHRSNLSLQLPRVFLSLNSEDCPKADWHSYSLLSQSAHSRASSIQTDTSPTHADYFSIFLKNHGHKYTHTPTYTLTYIPIHLHASIHKCIHNTNTQHTYIL